MFDASNRDQCEVNRSHTNTPLQALVMMNDPIILEASLALADGQMSKYGSDSRNAITNSFRKIICRKPEKKELEILENYLKEKQSWFKAHPEAVEKVVKVGEYKTKSKVNAELASMMQVIQVIYNMEEAITKA
jgi:hypothetical protein